MELAAGAGAVTGLNLDFAALDPCPRGSPDSIVVCGTRGARSPYRLPLLPHDYDRKPFRGDVNVGGVNARASVQSAARPDGLVDKRVMITLRAPFR